MNSIVATILIQRNYHRGRGYNSSQTLIKETDAVFKLQSQRKQRDTCTCSEKESIRKLTYFNLQGTKPLYQNNFSKLHSFSHFFRAINVIVTVIAPNFLWEPEKTNQGHPTRIQIQRKPIDVKTHFNYTAETFQQTHLPLLTHCRICQRRGLQPQQRLRKVFQISIKRRTDKGYQHNLKEKLLSEINKTHRSWKFALLKQNSKE